MILRAALLALALLAANVAVAAPTVDYAALRARAAARADFNGYAATLAERDLMEELQATWATAPVETLAKARAYADANPHSILAHRVVAETYEAALDAPVEGIAAESARAGAARYRAAYEGLVKSVLASGDGSSCATAYRVISINEEYEVLLWLKLTPSDQALVQEGARVCDAFKATADDWTERQLHFDISGYFGKMT
jgi:hypothetical protein